MFVIKTVGVVGAGTMGAGIAQLCAQEGFFVRLLDVSDDILAKARERLEKGIDAGVRRGKISPHRGTQAKAAVRYSGQFEDLASSDIIFEAAAENLSLKRDIFKKLDVLAPRDRVLATNTSSMSVQEIAAKTKYPGRVMGAHFFNPPVIMQLVEIIRTPATLEEHFQTVRKFVTALGKTAVQVKDTPGFIVNRVLRPYYIEAFRMLESGRAGIGGIDEAAVHSGGVPMGPCALADLIGLDVNWAVTGTLYEGLGRPERLRPVELQRRIVEMGYLGVKTGRGFYIYEGSRPVRENPEVIKLLPRTQEKMSPQALWEHLERSIYEEAERLYQEGSASKEDIDTAMRLGANFPKGPFETVQARG